MAPMLPNGARLALLGAASVGLGLLATLVHVPSSALLAGLVVGLAYALTIPSQLRMPKPVSTLAQAIVGVVAGQSLQTETLAAIGANWLPVTGAIVLTLAVSIGAGFVVARVTGLDQRTASLGLVAGGASGIVAVAGELGADSRLVAFMQYLRVLVVVVLAPFVATLFAANGDGGGEAFTPPTGPGFWWDVLFTVVLVAVGIGLTFVIRFSGASVLVPLALAAIVAATGLSQGAQVPQVIEDLALVVIGLQVALGFTRAAIRQAGRLLPVAFGSIVALILACAGIAWLLTLTVDVSYADAYLATTPGGLYAVLAAASSTGGNLTFVVAVQTLRVLAMLVLAPLLVRFLSRNRGGGAD